MASAAHCTDDSNYGQQVGPYWESGNEYYGVERNIHQFEDVMLLGSSNQIYSRRMHTDPCSPSACVRWINGVRRDPYMGMGVCTNGMVSRAECGGAVTDSFFQCAFTCVRRWEASKPGVIIARPGDSGGPLYGRDGSTEANARGMILGGYAPNGDDQVVFNSVRTLEDALGATVATSGGDRSS